jgi:Clp amino terminal domain, pathogenicity island component
MFERYTEKARRVIFFARYEASNYGSTTIKTEHILLGLLREEHRIIQLVRGADIEFVRKRIDAEAGARPKISTSVDLPLSDESKRVLRYAAEEADGLNHRHIGSEHLLLGMLREKDCFAAKLLCERGADLAALRARIEKQPGWYPEVPNYSRSRSALASTERATIEIHGVPRTAATILEAVKRYRQYPWQWDKRAWNVRDVIVSRKDGRFSFNMSLAEDAANFELVKGGWKQDHCVICHWKLYESKEDAEHGTGYTNGRDWVCSECYDKFWQRPDFIAGAFSDIT